MEKNTINDVIKHMRACGATVQSISIALTTSCGLHNYKPSVVHKVLTFGRGRLPAINLERDKEICCSVLDQKCLQKDMAIKYGLTRQRIWGIVKKERARRMRQQKQMNSSVKP